jgi:hypothetical protein
MRYNMRKWIIIARHKWVNNTTITESYYHSNNKNRRFVATVNGWRNFVLYEGEVSPIIIEKIINKVKYIKSKIENNDDIIFYEDIMIK